MTKPRSLTNKRLLKQAAYDEVVLDIFLKEGWGALSHQHVSDVIGIGKSSLQTYYPKAPAFGKPLEGNLFPVMKELLTFDSPELFVSSWNRALNESVAFRNIAQLMLLSPTMDEPLPVTRSVFRNLVNWLEASNEGMGDHLARYAIGAIAVYFMEKGLDTTTKSVSDIFGQ